MPNVPLMQVHRNLNTVIGASLLKGFIRHLPIYGRSVHGCGVGFFSFFLPFLFADLTFGCSCIFMRWVQFDTKRQRIGSIPILCISRNYPTDAMLQFDAKQL